jgi:hypothetical protein
MYTDMRCVYRRRQHLFRSTWHNSKFSLFCPLLEILRKSKSVNLTDFPQDFHKSAPDWKACGQKTKDTFSGTVRTSQPGVQAAGPSSRKIISIKSLLLPNMETIYIVGAEPLKHTVACLHGVKTFRTRLRMPEWAFLAVLHCNTRNSTSTAHVYIDKSRDVVGVKRKVSNSVEHFARPSPHTTSSTMPESNNFMCIGRLKLTTLGAEFVGEHCVCVVLECERLERDL